MRSEKVLQRLEQVIGIAGSPRKLGEAIEVELRQHFGLLPIQAMEEAERLEAKVRQLIIQSSVDSSEQGSYSVLSLSSMNDRIVLGSCHVGPKDSPSVAQAKRQRLQIEPLLEQIRSLTFDQSEAFGACVLKELGAKMVKVTPRSGDQGIDFYGLLSLGQQSDLPPRFGKLAHDVTLRFAGQAKHYPDRAITPQHIRELVGSIDLARYQVFTRDTDLFDDLELLALNPLVAMFFTTGYFSRGALELAERAGIIARSGEQLAVFLADRRVGIEEIDGVMQFSSGKFLDWLSTHST
jgi:hypothetical protein